VEQGIGGEDEGEIRVENIPQRQEIVREMRAAETAIPSRRARSRKSCALKPGPPHCASFRSSVSAKSTGPW
jgi:hypothetical protein